MNLFKRVVLILSFMIGAASGLACPQPLMAGTKADDVLRLFYWQAPTIFNPYLATGNKDREVCRIVYEPLASPDADGNLVPILAEEIPTLRNKGLAEDGKSVTWKLKPGIKWSDGHPFSADDVLFTWQFIEDPATEANGRSVYECVKSIEVIDPLTLKIIFHDVNPVWNVPFVGKQGMILPRHTFEKYKGKNARQSKGRLAEVGTGPYRMKKIKVRETLLIGEDVVEIVKIIYEPNPFFREKGKPYFKRLELHGGGDSIMAARAVLFHGSADFAWNLQAGVSLLSEMKKAGRGWLFYEPTSYTEKIVINFTDPSRPRVPGIRHPFFSRKKVRQALAHAVNREAIASLYDTHNKPVTRLIVMPAIFKRSGKPEKYPFDLKRSAALLDEAGWKDSNGDGIRDKNGVPMRIRFQTSVNPIRQKTQRIVRRDLESIGIEVALKMIDSSIFFGKNDNPNHFMQFEADIEEYSSGNLTPDPASFLLRWTCDQISSGIHLGSFANHTGYCNPAFDGMFKQLGTMLDPAKRRDLITRMDGLLIEDVAFIPLIHRTRMHAVSNSLEHVVITPWEWTTWNIKEWKRKP